MKNVHILPTDKPSRLFLNKVNGKLLLDSDTYCNLIKILPSGNYQNVYITSSDEEIKEGDWFYDGDGDLCKYTSDYVVNPNGWNDNKKIILTTDQDLIKDGVQAIDDIFLEWFVKNPSCEEVEVDKNWNYPLDKSWEYKIIIPKEEQKQHLIDMMQGDEELGLYEESKQEITLEEVAERIAMTKDWDFESSEGNGYYDYVEGFTEGAKWQQERMYSEEEVKHIVLEALQPFTVTVDLNQWFEQFKKK